MHEFAHVLDLHAGHVKSQGDESTPILHGFSGSPEWASAMTGYRCAVSEYAGVNHREDFAESVVAYFAYYGGRNGILASADRRALKHRLGRRFAALSRLIHDHYQPHTYR